MSSDEDYVAVNARLVKVTPDAAILFVGGRGGRTVSIARSLMHGADERLLDGHRPMTAITLRIFSWKAREQGLLETRAPGAARDDLFGGSP
jgi:hypothetical protein